MRSERKKAEKIANRKLNWFQKFAIKKFGPGTCKIGQSQTTSLIESRLTFIVVVILSIETIKSILLYGVFHWWTIIYLLATFYSYFIIETHDFALRSQYKKENYINDFIKKMRR